MIVNHVKVINQCSLMPWKCEMFGQAAVSAAWSGFSLTRSTGQFRTIARTTKEIVSKLLWQNSNKRIHIFLGLYFSHSNPNPKTAYQLTFFLVRLLNQIKLRHLRSGNSVLLSVATTHADLVRTVKGEEYFKVGCFFTQYDEKAFYIVVPAEEKKQVSTSRRYQAVGKKGDLRETALLVCKEGGKW